MSFGNEVFSFRGEKKVCVCALLDPSRCLYDPRSDSIRLSQHNNTTRLIGKKNIMWACNTSGVCVVFVSQCPETALADALDGAENAIVVANALAKRVGKATVMVADKLGNVVVIEGGVVCERKEKAVVVSKLEPFRDEKERMTVLIELLAEAKGASVNEIFDLMRFHVFKDDPFRAPGNVCLHFGQTQFAVVFDLTQPVAYVLHAQSVCGGSFVPIKLDSPVPNPFVCKVSCFLFVFFSKLSLKKMFFMNGGILSGLHLDCSHENYHLLKRDDCCRFVKSELSNVQIWEQAGQLAAEIALLEWPYMKRLVSDKEYILFSDEVLVFCEGFKKKFFFFAGAP